MSKVQIVEPWHPDIMTKEFVANLFSGKSKYEAKRYVELNPTDVKGTPAAFKAGEWIHYKGKPQTQGVVLETYLTERWLNKGTTPERPMLRNRPHEYELTCLVKWMPKGRMKDGETSIVSATSLRSLSIQIKALEDKLKKYSHNSETLIKYYQEYEKQSKFATVSTEG